MSTQVVEELEVDLDSTVACGLYHNSCENPAEWVGYLKGCPHVSPPSCSACRDLFNDKVFMYDLFELTMLCRGFHQHPSSELFWRPL